MFIAFIRTRAQRFLFLGVFLAIVAASISAASAAGVDVTLLFFNDHHGHLSPFELKTDGAGQSVGGMARIATLVRQVREENAAAGVRTVLVVAGDILQGTPLSTVFKGQADVACFNAMGVDAVTVGNHEFDFGLDNFKALVQQARFVFMSANIRWKDGGRPLVAAGQRIALGDGLFIHFIAVTTPELLTLTRPEYVAPLSVAAPVSVVRDAVDRIQGKGPVVLVSHSRHRTDIAIGSAVPELAAIIAGHDHLLFDPPRHAGSVPVYQALDYGRYLGRLDLRVDSATGHATTQSWRYIPITADIPPDPEVAGIIASYEGRLGAQFKETIGEAVVDLDAARATVRFGETNWGDLVADVVRTYSGAQIALVNSGGLRASIYKGPITVESIFRALPFTNEIVILEVTGATLRAALARSVSPAREDEDGGFLQVSGLRFRIEGKAPVDIRIGDGRQPLADGQTYRVAVPDYLASGGDQYTMFAGLPRLDTGLPLRDIVVEDIRRKGRIAPAVDGRIARGAE
ncbi:MAG: 5'-nucleotidase C-terminal domain-containing protein [Pseudomonadota bacterium]